MPKARNKYADYLVYLAVRTAEAILRVFDVRALYGLCAVLGDLMFRFDRRHRHRAMEHLRRSFPHLAPAQVERAARLSMRNLFYLAVEVAFTQRKITIGGWRQRIVLRDAGEAMGLQLRRAGGMILVTGHFGNWEVLGYTMAMLGIPTVSIARRLDNPYLDQFIFGIRRKTGQVIIDKRGASQVAPDVLDNKGVVGFIADQDAGRKGAFVDFFGRKASTYKSIALLAIQHQAPVVIGFGRRLEEDFQFELGVERIIYPTEWADKPDPVMWITQEYTSVLEQVIRRTPDQYLWVHRRWKHRPKGEPKAVDGIA